MSKVVRLKNSRTPKEFADIIRAKWQENVKSIFETAVMLETARDELGPAGFQEMLSNELDWSKSMASQLLRIARSQRLAEVGHAQLPASWDTLSRLARLTDEEFAAGLAAGIIHAGMQRKDIKKLKPPKPAPTDRPVTRRVFGPIRVCARDVHSLVFTTLQELEPDDRRALLARLRKDLDDLEAQNL